MSCVEDLRKPPPQINGFRQFVIDELLRRKRNYPTPTIAPFVRMTSCMEDAANRYRYFTMGLHGYTEPANIFDITYGSEREIVGYAHDISGGGKRFIDASELTFKPFAEWGLSDTSITPKQIDTLTQAGMVQKQGQDFSKTPAGGAHPIPGITGINITRFAQGAGMKVQVNWQCYNRQQLEFLRHHFMTVGTFVVVEWGQNFSDFRPTVFLDFSSPDITLELAAAASKGRHYIYENYVCPNKGNYDFVVGVVGNFIVDLDAMTNIYKCQTVLYTSGEFLWGVSVNRTIVDLQSPDGKQLPTIADFFQNGAIYDQLVQNNIDGAVVSQPGGFLTADAKQPGGFQVVNTPDLKDLPQNPDDYRFITWKYFNETILTQLLSFVKIDNIRKDILSYLDFYHETNESPNEDGKLWVGCHPLLKSIEPEALVLMMSTMYDAPSAFKQNGFFDVPGSYNGGPDAGTKGLLDQGVWLNVGMIRESFLHATTFQQAMQQMLVRMSNATAGYWLLEIYYDDQQAKYRIIDAKFGSYEIPDLYKFNTNAVGECLHIDLDSAFPPEIITQLGLVARLKSDPNLLKQSLKQYPLIGTTSHFAFAMNWTNLEDLVQKQLSQNEVLSTLNVFSPIVEGDSIRNTARVALDSSNVSPIVKTSPENPPPANPIEKTFVSNLNPENEFSPNRNSVAPTMSKGEKAVVKKVDENDSSIQEEANRLILPANDQNWDKVALIKAIIATESGGNANAQNPQGSWGGVGLMQVSVKDPNQAYYYQFPKNNIKAGIDIFNSFSTKTQTVQDTLSAYNGGLRPNLGFGGPYNGASGPVLRVCLQWNPGTSSDPTQRNLDRDCAKIKAVAKGERANQDYVNRILRYYQMFSSQTTNTFEDALKQVQAPVSSSAPPPTINPPVVSADTKPTISADEQFQLSLNARMDAIAWKFGWAMMTMIEPWPTRMVSRITSDGIENHPQKVNSFVAPFPTTAKVTVKIQGISGLSLFDGFFVDKLPYIYESYGCFQIVEVNETISEQGWVTTIGGRFRLLFLDGQKHVNSIS